MCGEPSDLAAVTLKDLWDADPASGDSRSTDLVAKVRAATAAPFFGWVPSLPLQPVGMLAMKRARAIGLDQALGHVAGEEAPSAQNLCSPSELDGSAGGHP